MTRLRQPGTFHNSHVDLIVAAKHELGQDMPGKAQKVLRRLPQFESL